MARLLSTDGVDQDTEARLNVIVPQDRGLTANPRSADMLLSEGRGMSKSELVFRSCRHG
jgi:hypothetical protein